jgi:hypothetical protein
MFSFLKRTPEKVESDDQATIRRLLKEAEETKAVLVRMARDLQDQAAKVCKLEEDIVRIDEFNDAIAEFGTDGSLELKEHERQLAGLWAWRSRVNLDVAAIKAKL